MRTLARVSRRKTESLPVGDSAAVRRMKRYLPFVIIVVVLAATVAAGVALYRKHLPKPVPTVGDPGAEPPHARGDERAPVLLEEFGDFECPPCGKLAPEIETLAKSYGRKLRLVFREYPLIMHKHAAAAARAAEAAGLQGHFWEMHHLLYETQAAWSAAVDPQAIFENDATKIGLDLPRFKTDMNSEVVKSRIIADQARATSLHVESTPSVFVNNQVVKAGPGVADRLRTAIDAALTKK